MQALIDYYAAHAATRTNCQRSAGGMWPTTKRASSGKSKYPGLRADPNALILNVGAGTTGTRFVNCVVAKMGVRAGHNINHHDVNKTMCKETSYSYQELDQAHTPSYSKSCTVAWDHFNFASDSPVPYELAGILSRYACMHV